MVYADYHMIARMLEMPNLYSREQISDAIALLRKESRESVLREAVVRAREAAAEVTV